VQLPQAHSLTDRSPVRFPPQNHSTSGPPTPPSVRCKSRNAVQTPSVPCPTRGGAGEARPHTPPHAAAHGMHRRRCSVRDFRGPPNAHVEPRCVTPACVQFWARVPTSFGTPTISWPLRMRQWCRGPQSISSYSGRERPYQALTRHTRICAYMLSALAALIQLTWALR
jgi:hypothetical protein